MDKTKFGTFIKNSRVKKNYTQKQLADIALKIWVK